MAASLAKKTQQELSEFDRAFAPYRKAFTWVLGILAVALSATILLLPFIDWAWNCLAVPFGTWVDAFPDSDPAAFAVARLAFLIAAIFFWVRVAVRGGLAQGWPTSQKVEASLGGIFSFVFVVLFLDGPIYIDFAAVLDLSGVAAAMVGFWSCVSAIATVSPIIAFIGWVIVQAERVHQD